MEITDCKTFYFRHIPKAGGSTISNSIKRYYPSEVKWYWWIFSSEEEDFASRTHFTYEEMEKYDPERLEYSTKLPSFCCVRDPVDRFISMYIYEFVQNRLRRTAIKGRVLEDLEHYLDTLHEKTFSENKYFIQTHRRHMYDMLFYRGNLIPRKIYNVTNISIKKLVINGHDLPLENTNAGDPLTKKIIKKSLFSDERLYQKVKDYFSEDYKLLEDLKRDGLLIESDVIEI